MLTVKRMLELTLELTLRLACGPDAEADARLKLAGQMELQVIPHLALKLEPSSHLKGRPEADALMTFLRATARMSRSCTLQSSARGTCVQHSVSSGLSPSLETSCS